MEGKRGGAHPGADRSGRAVSGQQQEQASKVSPNAAQLHLKQQRPSAHHAVIRSPSQTLMRSLGAVLTNSHTLPTRRRYPSPNTAPTCSCSRSMLGLLCLRPPFK